jgi:hypothetical protein
MVKRILTACLIALWAVLLYVLLRYAFWALSRGGV